MHSIDTCNKLVITSHTINQDGDIANDVVYRTVSHVVENSEIQILNNTCDIPFITNQDGYVANEARPHLNSNTTSGQFLDFSGRSTQPNPRSDNTKGSKKNTSRAQKPQLTRLSIHTRKQRKSTPKSKKVKRAHKTVSTKIVKPQTKQNGHQNLITELLTFLSHSNLKFQFTT